MQAIPIQYSSEAQNISPPLAWSNIPLSAKEWILICEDPDAPREKPVLHWVLYNIPITIESLSEAIPVGEMVDLLPGTRQAKNTRGVYGYMGPLPPIGHGVHRYFFQLFALDTHLATVDTEDREAFITSFIDNVVGYGELIGTYERK
jgi:Raf kinase inhibitor-like YbhB/YbcL family protein